MKVHILHITEEVQIRETGGTIFKLEVKHHYSVWAAESQAQKAFAKYFEEKAIWKIEPTMNDVVSDLIKSQRYLLAMNVLNKYSAANIPNSGRSGFEKITVEIIPSDFLGSPFD